ncbi:MAG: signal transduction histidine kinase [Myxococcota bacterium]|jgi:signal transduction histidine kinase
MKNSLARKVRALGVLQVTLVAAVMILFGVLFFNKMLADASSFKEGTLEVKEREAEGMAKLLALELGRTDRLRYIRSAAGDRVAKEVRAVLWEKVTFIGELESLDLVSLSPVDGGAVCLRPMGSGDGPFVPNAPTGCEGMDGLQPLLARYNSIERLERTGEGEYVLPLYVGGTRWGLMRLRMSNSTVQHILTRLSEANERDKVAYGVLFVVCLAIVGGTVFLVLASFFRRMHRPLIELTARAETFGADADPEIPDAPINADPEDEIGVLTGRFHDMQTRLVDTLATLRQTVHQKERAIAEREEADQMLRQSERLASVGVLAAGVAHEIGNKLNPMGFVVHNLKRRIEKGKPLDPAQIDVLTRSIESCTTILDKLRSMARPGDDRTEPVPLKAVVDDVVTMLGSQSESRGIELVAEISDAETAIITGNRSELVQVVINLVVNARDAIDPEVGGGRIEVRSFVDDSEHPTLEVVDNGSGMTEEVKDRVFEPFFSTKGLATGGTEGGTGLGLYICYGILSRHGVEPEIETTPGSGTRFRMRFPIPGRTGENDKVTAVLGSGAGEAVDGSTSSTDQRSGDAS